MLYYFACNLVLLVINIILNEACYLKSKKINISEKIFIPEEELRIKFSIPLICNFIVSCIPVLNIALFLLYLWELTHRDDLLFDLRAIKINLDSNRGDKEFLTNLLCKYLKKNQEISILMKLINNDQNPYYQILIESANQIREIINKFESENEYTFNSNYKEETNNNIYTLLLDFIDMGKKIDSKNIEDSNLKNNIDVLSNTFKTLDFNTDKIESRNEL